MSLLLLYKPPLAAGGPVSVNAGLASGTGRIGTAPTTIASDDFSDTVSSSLGTADIGGAWTVAGTAAEYDKTGGVGVIEVAASGIHFASLTSLAVQDSDITVMTKITTLPTGGSVFSYLTSRTIAATDLYWTQLEWRTTGGIRGGIARRIGNTGSGGTLVALDDVAFGSLTYTAGDWFWMRMQTIGVSPTTIRLKIWKDGTPEPAAWQQETTDATSPLQSTGAIGLGNNAGSGLSNGPAFTSFETYTATEVVLAGASGHIKPNAAFAAGTGIAGSDLNIASDAFGRTLSDQWGSADVGGAWTITEQTAASDEDVAGGQGTLVIGVAGQNTQAALAGISVQNLDVTVTAAAPALPVGASIFLHVGARSTGTTIGSDTRYVGQAEVATTGVLTFNFFKRVAGVQTTIGSVGIATGITLSAAQLFNLRFKVEGINPTTLYGKVWLAANPEPPTWLTTNTDSEATLQISGIPTLRVTSSGSTSNVPIGFAFEQYEADRPLGSWVNIKPNAGIATGTGTALGVVVISKPVAAVATGTGVAYNVIPLVKPNVGLASGTGAAHAPPVKIEPRANVATGVGTAYDVTAAISADVNAAAELATGTGTAHIVSALIKPNASAASATGAASNASPHVKPNASVSTATGAANTASESIKSSALLSSGTGSAALASVHVRPNAGLAAGTGAALDATVTTVVPQVLRPIADLSGNWHGEDARTTTLYTSVDDDPFNDATYVESPDDPTSSDFHEFDLPTAADPLSSSDHIVRYRYGGEGTATLIVELRQGATVIASWSHVNPTTPALAEQTLTGPEADAITDYSDLRIRVRAA